MPRLILASSSKTRHKLLEQIGYKPDAVIPADIDERPLAHEDANMLVKRLSKTKAIKISKQHPDDIIIAGDTVAYTRRKILGKPSDIDEARAYINLFSGRRHKVYSGLCIVSGANVHVKSEYSIVKFKRLSHQEIERFLSSGQWQSMAGGYTIQGMAAAFITKIVGCPGTIMGMNLSDAHNLISRYIP